MTSRRTPVIALLAVLVGLGCSSGSPSATRIDVIVDVDPALMLDQVTLEASAPGKAPFAKDLPAAAAVRWTIQISDAASAFRAEVTARGRKAGAVTVSYGASVQVSPQQTVQVRMRLDAACAGLQAPTCGPAETCDRGACIPRPVFGTGADAGMDRADAATDVPAGDTGGGDTGGGDATAPDDRADTARTDATPDGPETGVDAGPEARIDAGKSSGSTCQSGGECATGFCVDGHCCARSSCDPCSTCAGPDGACAPVTNVEDPDTCSGVRKCNAGGSCIDRFTEFAISGASNLVLGVAAGPDGNIWFVDGTNALAGRFTTSGTQLMSFPIGTGPNTIVAGPDGNMWFTEGGAKKIGRITTSGSFLDFLIPSGTAPNGIVLGMDNNLWFITSGFVGRVTTSGSFTEFAVPTPNSVPLGIAAGSDGNIWFVEYAGNKVGRVTAAGVIMEFPLPTATGGMGGIVAGADGNLWFAEFAAKKIGRITLSGTITEFDLPSPAGSPSQLTRGPDGNVWFTESEGRIGRITPGGAISEFPVPTPGGEPYGITAGPDGNIWFVERTAIKMVRFVP